MLRKSAFAISLSLSLSSLSCAENSALSSAISRCILRQRKIHHGANEESNFRNAPCHKRQCSLLVFKSRRTFQISAGARSSSVCTQSARNCELLFCSGRSKRETVNGGFVRPSGNNERCNAAVLSVCVCVSLFKARTWAWSEGPALMHRCGFHLRALGLSGRFRCEMYSSNPRYKPAMSG